METKPNSPRATIRRKPQRGSYDRAVVHRILDEGLVAHVGFAVDGMPYVIPMVYGRLGDELILHGAVASRMLKQGSTSVPMCATVTLIDGLVLARSWFHHSMNYRSVVVFGTSREITDRDEKLAALTVVVDHATPGRSRESRWPDDKELAATRVIALPIEEASAKQRIGGPLPDEGDDAALPHWAGEIPLALRATTPVADPSCAGVELPVSLRERWLR
ncbi:MAG TPA: pyridoxamine 5'-phosphate oxidase family protein [Kofleriaceae bacterium]|nr:pyridoxamine 5'-phosphate oxidase family protein [Kofleriaceae bacterium]